MNAIVTPNLAEIAAPYTRSITDIWDNGFAFAQNARNGIVENARMPGRLAGAELEYMNNAYGIASGQATWDDRLQGDILTAQGGVMQGELDNRGRQADLDFFDEKRGIDENRYRSDNEFGMAQNEDGVGRARGSIEQRAAEAETNRRIAEAPGASPLEKSVSAYNTAMGDPSTPAAVLGNIYQVMMQGLISQLAVLPPNSPEYARVKSLLIMYGGYGVQTSPDRPRAAPRPSAASPGVGTAPGGLHYGIPEAPPGPGGASGNFGYGTGNADIGFAPSAPAAKTPPATAGGWTP